MNWLYNTYAKLRQRYERITLRAETMATASTVSPQPTHNVTAEQIVMESPPSLNGESGWFNWLPSWRPTSEELLIEAESDVLKNLTSEYCNHYVPMGDRAFVRTISMEPEIATPTSDRQPYPLVMVHGFGCGLAAFHKNFDGLHNRRKLYAFDVLGFGRSSRVKKFDTDAEKAEGEFVESFERWREWFGLEKIILLGHSLGAYMSCAYAMRYPHRVRHLILVDPWGFNGKPTERSELMNTKRYRVASAFVSLFNPLAFVRAVGPWGPQIISRFRPDLQDKFGPDFMSYVYHCNAQNPSGETAFANMTHPIVWAKMPMLERMDDLTHTVPMTMLHGTRSWFDTTTGEKTYWSRPHSYVNVHLVKGAGHHIHADTPDIFNCIVNNTCDLVDKGHDSERPEEEDAFHTH